MAGEWRVFELVVAPEALAARIAARTAWMLEAGLIEETQGLREAGLEQPLRALRAVGYDEALEVLAGRLTRAEAAASIDRRTRQLAKRQRTWFRHQVQAERLEGTRGGPEAVAGAILEALGA